MVYNRTNQSILSKHLMNHIFYYIINKIHTLVLYDVFSDYHVSLLYDLDNALLDWLEDRMFRLSSYHDLRSHLGTGSLCRVGNHRLWIVRLGREVGREYPHRLLRALARIVRLIMLEISILLSILSTLFVFDLLIWNSSSFILSLIIMLCFNSFLLSLYLILNHFTYTNYN